MPRNNAGPETVGPSTMMIVGTTPEQFVSARAANPHPCSAENPSRRSAPDEAITATSGSRESTAVRAAVAIIDEASKDNAPR